MDLLWLQPTLREVGRPGAKSTSLFGKGVCTAFLPVFSEATKVLGGENNCQLCQFMATAGPLREAFLNPLGRIGMAKNRMKQGFLEKDLMTGVG